MFKSHGVLSAQSCPTLPPRGLYPPSPAAPKAPPSMGLSRQEYWSGLPFHSPGDLPNPGIEPRSPTSQVDSLPSEPPGKLFLKARLARGHLALLCPLGSWEQAPGVVFSGEGGTWVWNRLLSGTDTLPAEGTGPGQEPERKPPSSPEDRQVQP